MRHVKLTMQSTGRPVWFYVGTGNFVVRRSEDDTATIVAMAGLITAVSEPLDQVLMMFGMPTS